MNENKTLYHFAISNELLPKFIATCLENAPKHDRDSEDPFNMLVYYVDFLLLV